MKEITVTSPINKALEEKEEALKREYLEAEKDPDRKKTIEEWKVLDAEGWPEGDTRILNNAQ